MKNMDGKKILPGVRYKVGLNGYFLDFGQWGGTGARISWMPKGMIRIPADTSLFHVMWWSHKRGIHHHLRLGKYQDKWWYWV